MSLEAVRRDSYVPANPPLESGPLGPLEMSFTRSGVASNELPDDQGLEETLTLLRREEQHFLGRARAIGQLLRDSEPVLAQAEERKHLAEARLREMKADVLKHHRHELIEAYEAVRSLEIEALSQRDHVKHLRTQVDAMQRAAQALTAARDQMERWTVAPSSHDLPLEWVPSASLPPAEPPLELSPPTEQDYRDLEAILNARAYEQARLSRGIVERLIGPMTNVMLGVQQCQRLFSGDPPRALQALAAVDAQLHGVLSDILMLKFELEPLEMDELGLAATLQRYVEYLRATRGVAIATSIAAAECRYHVVLERAVFRMAREALDNALRHSQAHHIAVSLLQSPHRLVLTVEDDGAGFVVDPVLEACRRDPGHGLGQLMLETDLIGGTIGIESGPGRGTRIDYVVDLDPQRDCR